MSLVVLIGEDDAETIIGSVRYSFINPVDLQRRAEVYFTVEEEYHGQGIAGSLMRHLTMIAREKGIHRFEAEVLSSNRGMLRVFERSNLSMTTKLDTEVVHVTLSFPEKNT